MSSKPTDGENETGEEHVESGPTCTCGIAIHCAQVMCVERDCPFKCGGQTMRYIYRVLRIPSNVTGLVTDQEIEKQLNIAGEEGWRLVDSRKAPGEYSAILEKVEHD